MNNTTRYIIFNAIVSFTSCVLFVLPYFINTPICNTLDLIKIISYFGVVSLANLFIIIIISSYKYIFSILFPLYTLLGTILTYTYLAYNATLTPMLIDASLHNDWNTSIELITWKAILYISIIIVLTIITIKWRFKLSIPKSHIWFLCSISAFLIFFNSSFRIKRGLSQRFPVILYSTINEYILNYQYTKTKYNPDTRTSSETKNDSLTLVFILGESLRADHIPMNGYHRMTTPKLYSEKNIISLPNIYSEYTYTSRSIPHIMTRADSINPEYAFTETSFIPSLSIEGFSSFWLSNQDICQSFAPFVAECDSSKFVHPEKSVFVFSDWYDIDILPTLKQHLNNNISREIIIIHTIGNHWYYNNHYPDTMTVFTPITKSRETSSNTPEEIINSYDNAIIATDYFINEVINMLKTKNALLIYLSDHGEALGENNEWLHANECESIKNPACFIWYSNTYHRHNEDKISALINNSKKRYRTDFLYHSILYGANNMSTNIDTSLVIFKKH